jgi:hypothetical protein
VDAQEILAMADERFERRLTEESAAIRQEIAILRSEMATRKDVSDLRQEMTAGFSRLERQIAESRVDILKWSFLFWTGQCFVIIRFLLVFLRNR